MEWMATMMTTTQKSNEFKWVAYNKRSAVAENRKNIFCEFFYQYLVEVQISLITILRNNFADYRIRHS